MKKVLFVMLILATLLIVGCGNTTTVEETVELKDDDGNKIGEINVKIEADVESDADCSDMNCFAEKFASCESAKITYQLMDSLSYHYEILGLKDGKCEIMSKYPDNPNPDWEDEEMVCLYDNSKDFETATSEVIESFNTETHLGSCGGKLYELMTNLG
jgi:hypothetical protein